MQHKKLLFITLLFSCYLLIGINAQDYEISFTGSGLSTTVDTVQVLNIAQGTSVTVKSTEGLQLVDTSTNIESHIAVKSNMRIFPNPLTETSGIEFFNFRESLVNIEVFDVTGKIVLRDKQNLIQGIHKFEISGLNPGIYMVNVVTFDGKYAEKLLSNSEISGTPTIRYLGNNSLLALKSTLKSAQNLVQMQYNEGESLLLKGISGNYSRVLTLIPTESQTVNFEFIACTDSAGMHYPVVTIGTQTWMAKNLAWLPSVSRSGLGSYSAPHYYVYGYQGFDESEAKATNNYQTKGVLYNWPAAINACPAEWHLPTDAEWTELQNYLIANGYNYDGTTTDNKIAKSLATSTGWVSSSTTGAAGNADYPEKRDATGFSALPGGSRRQEKLTGSFSFGDTGYWWSATLDYEYEGGALLRNVSNNSSALNPDYNDKINGFSVRCLKD